MKEEIPQWEKELKEVYYKGFDQFGYTAVDSTYDEIKTFIKEQLEKLIKDIPDSLIDDEGRDVTAGHLWKFKQQLRDKWL